MEIRAVQPAGRLRGMFSKKPPPVMWDTAFTVTAFERARMGRT